MADIVGQHSIVGARRRALPRTRPAALRRATGSADPAPQRLRGPGRRAALTATAMAACVGLAAVLMMTPNPDAQASPFYRRPALSDHLGLQRFRIDGGYVLVDVTRPDRYTSIGAETLQLSAGKSKTPARTAQAYAAKLVAHHGWASSEFSCLVDLWNKESGWNAHAYNPSGAYGIPQSLPGDKMAISGKAWRTDYRVQIRWGLRYISSRYGSPCGAWAHEVADNNY